jgi:hypothetical protein
MNVGDIRNGGTINTKCRKIRSLFKAKWTLLTAISWREQVIFNAIMMIPALYQTNMVSLIFIVLGHWGNSSRVDLSLHSRTLSQPVQFSYSLILRALRRGTKYQFHSLWFDPTEARSDELSHTRRVR